MPCFGTAPSSGAPDNQSQAEADETGGLNELPSGSERPREGADDGADSVACCRPCRPTALSTKPPCTQLTPSSADEHAENAGTQRHQPLRTKLPDLDPLENGIGHDRKRRDELGSAYGRTKSHRYFKHISVRSFILNGAPLKSSAEA